MVSGGGGGEKCYFNAAPKKVAKQVSRFTFKASGEICLRLPFYSNISNKVQYWCRQFLKVKRGKINNKTAVDVETELLSVGDIGNTMFPFHDVSTVYLPILYISNRQSECIYIYLYTKKKSKVSYKMLTVRLSDGSTIKFGLSFVVLKKFMKLK